MCINHISGTEYNLLNGIRNEPLNNDDLVVEYNIKDGNNEDEIVNMIDNVSNEDIITSGKNEEENKKILFRMMNITLILITSIIMKKNYQCRY